MACQHIRATYSPGYVDVRFFFDRTHPPFTLPHIREFNALYRRAYPTLSRPEKWRAEKYVDYLIDNVAHRAWVGKIYGVV